MVHACVAMRASILKTWSRFRVDHATRPLGIGTDFPCIARCRLLCWFLVSERPLLKLGGHFDVEDKKSDCVRFGCFCRTACVGQGEVVSFYATVQDSLVMVPSVPSAGLIITDVSVNVTSPVSLNLKENGVFKTDLRVGPSGHHFTSGIRFAPGTQLLVDLNGPTYNVTISGYIPSITGNVPAVGAWGMLVMVLMIVVAGTMVLRRRVAA